MVGSLALLQQSAGAPAPWRRRRGGGRSLLSRVRVSVRWRTRWPALVMSLSVDGNGSQRRSERANSGGTVVESKPATMARPKAGAREGVSECPAGLLRVLRVCRVSLGLLPWNVLSSNGPSHLTRTPVTRRPPHRHRGEGEDQPTRRHTPSETPPPLVGAFVARPSRSLPVRVWHCACSQRSSFQRFTPQRLLHRDASAATAPHRWVGVDDAARRGHDS